MKLLRVGVQGRERPAVLVGDAKALDVSNRVEDFDEDFFTGDGLVRLAAYVSDHVSDADDLIDLEADDLIDLEGVRIGPCIARPRKIVGVGLNYRDHAAEANVSLPTEPVIFLKSTRSLSGPYDDIVFPHGSAKVDWEVELGVIVRGTASHLSSPMEAEAHVAGYCVANDVSERSFQLERGGQWTKGKSADGFCPAGPYLVTRDEVTDVSALELFTTVNGELMQTATAGDMIFNPLHLVWYISQFITLEPGDLICTGTPAGVGLGQTPPRYLAAGDELAMGISGLGEQSCRCRASATSLGSETQLEST